MIKYRRQGGWWLLIASLGVLLVSAGGQDSVDTVRRSLREDFAARGWLSAGTVRVDVLRVGLSHMGPRTFNPAFAQDPESRLIAGMLSIDLLSAADTISWGPLEPAGTQLTVKLRLGLRWSDGNALIASDWVDAINEIYSDPLIDSVYAKPLAGLGQLRWAAADPLTVRIASTKVMTQSEMLSACFIAPQPMARLREWRKLGQAGGLGTGLRDPADDQYFGLIDSLAGDIPSCGRWQVSQYRPSNSLELTQREQAAQSGGLNRIQFHFFRDQTAMEQAFAAGSLDLLPTVGKVPAGFATAEQPKICAFAPAPLVVSLIINPEIAVRFPWITSLLDKGLDRQGWSRGFLQGLSLPERQIWAGKYPLAMAVDSASTTETPIQLAVQYDRSRADRAMLAGSLSVGNSGAPDRLTFRAVPSSVDDMAAWLAFGGTWDAMLVTIDETVDPTALLKLLRSRLIPIVPLYRPVALLWSRQELVSPPPDTENLFLAYAWALH